ncbi:MAG TPA: hypothetical protein VHC72_10170, partial [Bryobacteraceae bacterium]|nr:hypothetical protein [Bryobacteraceae bacterium]
GMAAVCLAIYLLGPGEVNGSFLFEKRFSMVVCFLIVALASGGFAVPLRTRQVMTSIALVSALTATLVDREATWKNIASLEPLLHAAPLEPGSRILAVRFGATRKTELHYDPWNAAASYWCLRTRAVLINLPWMDLDIMMLKAAPGATSIDYEDAGALIRKAIDEKRATLPLSPDGLVIERSALGPAEEDHLVSELTAHYGYSLLSPKGSVIVLARSGARTTPPNAQVSRKGF